MCDTLVIGANAGGSVAQADPASAAANCMTVSSICAGVLLARLDGAETTISFGDRQRAPGDPSSRRRTGGSHHQIKLFIAMIFDTAFATCALRR